MQGFDSDRELSGYGLDVDLKDGKFSKDRFFVEGISPKNGYLRNLYK